MTEETTSAHVEGALAQFEPARIEGIGPSYEMVVAVTTGEIVRAYIDSNSLSARDALDVLPKLVSGISGAFFESAPADDEEPDAPAHTVEAKSQAQIDASITPDALISFIDGKPYKTLKRHLNSHGLSVAGYRERYGLPSDYPTVAPSYSEARSDLAKAIGLGSRKPMPQRAA